MNKTCASLFYLRSYYSISMRFCLIAILILFTLRVSAQPTWLLHQKFAEKYYYIDSICRISNEFKGPEFYKSISALQKWASDNSDPELAINFEIVALKSKMDDKDTLNGNIERDLINLVRRAQELNFNYTLAEILKTLGVYHWSRGKNPNMAMEDYLTSYKLFKDYTTEEFPPKREYIYILGTAYYIFEDYENAIHFLKVALETKPEKRLNQLNAIYTSLGLSYRYKKNYDSSNWFFRKVYDDTDKAWKAITAGNIGINYFYEKKYTEAIPLLEQDISTSIRLNNNIRSAANSMYILSQIYLSQNEVEKAGNLVIQALQLCESKPFWPDYVLAEHLFTQLHKVYTLESELRLANLYADSAMVAKDSVQSRYNALSLSKAQEKTDFIQHKLETEKLQNQKDRHELIRNGLLALAVLLVIICILYINRQRLKQKKLEAEKKVAEADLENAAVKLESFRHSAQEKNQLIEHFTLELEKLKQTEAEQSDNELRSQLERATILTDEQWEDFRNLFEQVHKGFFGGLKKKYPDLTQAEIRFLALTKMKLTSKEMASMLGTSVNAIRMNRHRLRKKLDLDKDDMMEELVDDI